MIRDVIILYFVTFNKAIKAACINDAEAGGPLFRKKMRGHGGGDNYGVKAAQTDYSQSEFQQYYGPIFVIIISIFFFFS